MKPWASAPTGMTLAATLKRFDGAFNGYRYNRAAQAWQAAPSYADAKSSLGGPTGSDAATGTVSLGSGAAWDRSMPTTPIQAAAVSPARDVVSRRRRRVRRSLRVRMCGAPLTGRGSAGGSVRPGHKGMGEGEGEPCHKSGTRKLLARNVGSTLASPAGADTVSLGA